MSGLEERIAALSPEQRDALWAKLGVSPAAEKQGEIPRRTLQGPCPLSFAQQRLWFLHELEPESPAYNIPLALRLTGRLNVTALDKAFREIVRRHEALRTTFSIVGDQPSQIIADAGAFALQVRDLDDQPRRVREAEAERLAIEEAHRPFDLARGPMLRVLLLRLAPEDHVLLVTMHHIASDGWSVGVLTRELAALYNAYYDGRPSPLGELPIQYADFAVWQRAWLQGDVLEQQLAYWRTQLADAPALQVPTDRPRPAVQTYAGAVRTHVLSQQLVDGIRALSLERGVTSAIFILAAFKVLLHRYTGQSDIVVGQAIANRNRSEVESLIGFFVNPLAMRTDLSGDPTFHDLLDRVRQRALEAYAHQDLPFEKLVEDLRPARDRSQSPLFQVMYVFQNAPFEGLRLTDVSVSVFPAAVTTTRFDLELHVFEHAGSLQLVVYYSTDLFEPATIARMTGHFETLLAGAVANPRERVSRLPLLGEAERQQVLVAWNRTRTEYPSEATVHRLFEEQVARTPAAVALRFEGREVTYGELNARANRLARHLRTLGVEPEVLVGLSVERSVEMVVGILGILKAGGAYVPLDPEYPPARLALMLEDTRAPVVLTQRRLVGRLPPCASQVVWLDGEEAEFAGESAANPALGVTSEQLAYVMFTSGSTGRPKGTAIRHRGVVRLVQGTRDVELGPQEVLLQLAPISFDASTFELWGSLLNGGTLVVFPPHPTSLEELGEVIRREGITTLWLTAPLFHQMVESQLENLRGVRQLLTGGDILSVPHVQRVLATLGERRLINGYGPTENTTFTCCHVMTGASRVEHTVPIGRPVANTQVYVLDAHQQPMPIGAAGELYVGGDGLAREYWHAPELTAERFVSDPFGQEPGGRLYRTGDRVRWRTDGTLEFLGRLDHQVKIRGFRIELGEVEAALCEHPAVREAVAVVREDVPGDKRLVAYLVCDADVPWDEVRSLLRKRLPAYMVPSAFVSLPALPLHASGKVDRQTLPKPGGRRQSDAEYVAARTETERQLAAMWRDVLHVDRVGAHDDFFELGGHSLLATQVVSRIRDVFAVEVRLASLFEGPTIAALASAVERAAREGAGRKAPSITRVSRAHRIPRPSLEGRGK